MEKISMKLLIIKAAIIGGVLFLSACTSQDASVASLCPAERSDMCTMDYTPVCALTAAGDWSTKSNACSACGDAEVVGYNEGECE